MNTPLEPLPSSKKKYMFFDHRGGKVFLKKSSEATRPGGCWTIKENSLFSHIPPIIKFRPITAHNAHPQFYEDSALRLVCLFLLLLLRCANDFRTICQSGKHIRGMCSSFCGSFERQKTLAGPCSLHYWEISVRHAVIAVAGWELSQNSLRLANNRMLQ